MNVHRLSILSVCLGASMSLTLSGCRVDDASAAGTRRIASTASVRVAQAPLDGNSLPKFVDPLPTFQGRRIDGTSPIHVNMEEFQRKVLPATVYAGLAAPYSNGTFLWGYDLNGTGASWPARTIEARKGVTTNVTYTNNLINTKLQSLLTVDQSLH